jgi:xylan 1,4-beta-xylosidase
MFYTVNEQVCVATSDSPEGPFVQDVKQPLFGSEKNIDPSLFIDSDGKAYLYFVRFTGGNVIWCAEMNSDLKSLKEETLTKCIEAQDEWERKQATVAEGPSILKQNGVYYLLYSANHFESKDYAVGYATSDSPFGPWEKYSGNPILRRDMDQTARLSGTGHGAPFICEDGSYKYIFHAHASEEKVQPRSSYIKDLTLSDKGIASIHGTVIRPVVVK